MADYNFFESYPGPHGPHLSCLSAYTRTRKEEDRLRGESIHLRGSKKSNTCFAPTFARHRRVIAALEAHLLLHPADKQSEARLAKLTAELEASPPPAKRFPLAA